MSGLQEVADPIRDLGTLVAARIPLVCEDHDTIIALGSNDSAQTLRSLPHRVEVQELRFLDVVVLAQKLQPCSQLARQRVLEGHTEKHHAAPVVTVKVNPFCDLAAGHGKEDGALARVAGLAVQIEGIGGGHHIRGLNEDQLVLQYPCNDACLVPFLQYLLEVAVRGEEAYQAVGDLLHQLLQQHPVVLYHAGVFSQAEAR
mmetsp:Transcript_25384/g.60425  ORF Transcript_25384/g.60425 Transcript_25384/m.60425 type:complete len:201 (-) Transcript_25384:1749-2351(-)